MNTKKIIPVKHVEKFADERLVPELVPWHQKQMIRDHEARYMFAQSLIGGGVILDAACGSGYGSQILSRKAQKVYGVDISNAAITYAQQTYPSKKITFINSDVQQLPFDNQTIDSVVSFETLEHVSAHQNFINEVVRVLKSDGIFIVSTPNILVNGGDSNPFHLKELTQDEFVQLLKENFSHVELYGQKPMHKSYLHFVVWLTHLLPNGGIRWFVDSLLKMVFRGVSVKPLTQFQHGFVPAFFVAVCTK